MTPTLASYFSGLTSGGVAAVKTLPQLSQRSRSSSWMTAATGGYQLTDHVKQYYASARV